MRQTPFLFAGLLMIASLGAKSQPASQSYEDLMKRFDYDRGAPLDVVEAGVVDHRGINVHDISFASPLGGRVPAYLVVPGGKGPFAGIVWGHWYWPNSPAKNRSEFLDEAVAIAKSGVVSIMIDGPIARPGHVGGADDFLNEQQITDRLQSIADMRRAADVLVSRNDVDAARLGYVGHSYNASTGGYLAGIDSRFKAFVLMAGTLSDKVDLQSKEYQAARQKIGPDKFDAFVAKYAWLDPGIYISHTSAAIFLQYATEEDYLTPARAKQYYAVVGGRKQMKMYETNHALNAEARHGRVAFLQRELKLGRIDWDAVAKVPQLAQPPQK